MCPYSRITPSDDTWRSTKTDLTFMAARKQVISKQMWEVAYDFSYGTTTFDLRLALTFNLEFLPPLSKMARDRHINTVVSITRHLTNNQLSENRWSLNDNFRNTFQKHNFGT